MNQEKRPGGLTALAVINFIFSGWNLIGLLGLAVLFGFVGQISTDNMNEAQRTNFEAFQNMGLPMLIFIFALTIITSVLLLLSGIGYLKQKKVMGWVLGNAYAVISIISSVVSVIILTSEMAGGGFTIGTIVNLIYPILTLILLNTTFKEDLTN